MVKTSKFVGVIVASNRCTHKIIRQVVSVCPLLDSTKPLAGTHLVLFSPSAIDGLVRSCWTWEPVHCRNISSVQHY